MAMTLEDAGGLEALGQSLGNASTYGDGAYQEAFDGLGDAVMLLEGPPSGLEAAVFGDLGSSVTSYFTFPEETRPVSSEEVEAPRAKAPELGTQIKTLVGAVSRRRAALVTAKAESKVAAEQAKKWEKIRRRMAAQAARAKRAGRPDRAQVFAAKATKAQALSETAQVRSVQYIKAAALAQIATKNAKTEAAFLQLAQQAKAKGQHAHAKVLVKAARKVAAHTEHLKALREEQIRLWKGQTAARRVGMARAGIKASSKRLSVLGTRGKSAAPARAAHRAKIVRLKAILRREKPIAKHWANPGGGWWSAGGSGGGHWFKSRSGWKWIGPKPTGGYPPQPTGDGIHGLSGFGDLGKISWNSIKEKVGKAAKKIMQKGVCKIATNPNVQAAAVAFGPQGAGGAAVAALACPKKKVSLDEGGGAEKSGGGGGGGDDKIFGVSKPVALVAGGGAALVAAKLLHVF